MGIRDKCTASGREACYRGRCSVNTVRFKQTACRIGRPGYLWPRTVHGLPIQQMQTLTDRLRMVQGQVHSLVKERKALHERLAELERNAREHDRVSQVLSQRLAELERENEVLRTMKPAASAAGVPGAKERIDQLVQEIDRCLGLIQA